MMQARTLGEMGEREFIMQLSQWSCVGKQADGAFGIGDDCAALPAMPGNMDSSAGPGETILTTDLLIEGTHFLRNSETNWYLTGYKAAAANISDLAAAGAIPRALLIGIGAPQDFAISALSELYRGINACCGNAEVRIMGGDMTRADALMVSVTAVGWKANGWAALCRSDAEPGDTVYVTGPLGGSRAGLELLLHPDQRDAIGKDIAEELICRHFVPPSRLDAGVCLARAGGRAAVIDISDSLFNEAGLLAEASNAQLTIELSSVPIDSNALSLCERIGYDSVSYALFSGEEYELLFTSPLPCEKLAEQFAGAGVECQLIPLGRVERGSGVQLLRNGEVITVSDQTFRHFN